MKYRNSISLLVFVVVFGLTAFAQGGVDSRIIYTGKLLGYYRTPDRQPDYGCAGDSSPRTEAFKTALRSELDNNPHSILVGMGSNFGPNYESRFLFSTGNPTPKPRNVPWRFPADFCDNVANFFVQSQYSALTLGREDFLSGSQRMMVAARWMLTKPVNPVHVLAANLTIRTARPKEAAEKIEPDGYLTSHPLVKGSVQQVLPWQRSFTLTFTNKVIWNTVLGNLFFCETVNGPFTYDPTHSRTPAIGNAFRSGCDPIPQVGDAIVYAPNKSKLSIDFKLNTTLLPDHSYGICVQHADASVPAFEIGDKPYCLIFTVERPFVESPFEEGAHGRAVAGVRFTALTGQQLPWFLDQEKHMVVFGVVDGTLRSQISHENAVWHRESSEPESQLFSFGPEIALKQVLALFDDLHPHWVGTRVLLAQMPLGKAQELAAHFRFDVVIAEGDEDHATDHIQTKFWTNEGYAKPFFLVAPHPAGGNVYLPVSLVNITRPQPDNQYVTFENDPRFTKTDVAACSGILAEIEMEYHIRNSPKDHIRNSPKEPFNCVDLEQFVLKKMREELKADVAIIQKRDVYSGIDQDLNGNHRSLQEELDRLFWKGDLLAQVSLSGAQLKALLQASSDIAQSEESQTQIIEVKGRSLVLFGINSVKGDYYVDGQKLDDKRQYMVATTDFIALGETGFPQLSPASGADTAIFHHGNPRFISVLACDPGLVTDPLFAPGHCRSQAQQSNFYNAAVNDQWDDRRPRVHPLLEWAKNWKASEVFASLRQSELTVQNRWLRHFALQDLSGSAELYHPNIPDRNIAAVFGGVSEATASQAHSTTFEINEKSRLVWEGRQIDLAPFETNLAFSGKRTGSTDPTKLDSLSLPKDNFTIGPFFQAHFHKFVPRWKALVVRPFDVSVEPRPQFFTLGIQLKPPPDAKPGTPTQVDRFSLDLLRQKSYANKLGTRYEKDSQNYAEVGYQLRQDFDVLRQVIFNPGTANEFTCGLDPAVTIFGCATSKANLPKLAVNSTSQQLHGTFHSHGLYWDMKGTAPLIPVRIGLSDFSQWVAKISWVVDSQGNFFVKRPSDINTLTWYSITTGVGVKLPIYGNLALEPRNEWYLYQNKVLGSTLQRLHFKMTLSYNFDWYTGAGPRQSTQFNPSPSTAK